MSKRKLKCQRCSISDTTKDEMDVEYVGKNNTPKYYHKQCMIEHQEEKEFKKKEAQELDVLVEKIKEIYGVKSIPNSIYPYLQDLRNGTKFFGKDKKRYKEGYPYDLIAETFDYCSETIEYWNTRKSFNGFSSQLRYGLAIVSDKIHLIEERRKKREKEELQVDKFIENISDEEFSFEKSYKKPSKHTDITDFLDD